MADQIWRKEENSRFFNSNNYMYKSNVDLNALVLHARSLLNDVYPDSDIDALSLDGPVYINKDELRAVLDKAVDGGIEEIRRISFFLGFKVANFFNDEKWINESFDWLEVSASLGDSTSQYEIANYFLNIDFCRGSYWAKRCIDNPKSTEKFRIELKRIYEL